MTSSTDFTESTRESRVVVLWFVPTIALVLCLAGLGVAIYMTVLHYTGELPVCSANGLVNCEEVTTSPQSMVFGVPVALLGLLYFAAMTVLCLPPFWRPDGGPFTVARLAGVGLGVLFVVYLVAAELLLIGKICLWCTSVHVIVLLLAGTLVAHALGWGIEQTNDRD